MTIDEFIETVAPKLAMPVKKTWDTMTGRELKLTGYKEIKGKPIEDHKIYKIPVPVSEKVDHKKKLRLAWLRGGKPALRTYLERILKPADLKKVTPVIWRLNQKS